jgi:RHS repeat-associated protein
MIFFYHKDLPKAFGMGSSTQISDPGANIIQHIEYLPYGETFFERRSYWNTPYKFNAKELDEETGMYYYGARYYTPEVSIWLSVDPLADLFASKSPFAYCFNNPVHFIDEDGNWPWEAKNVRAARKLSRKTGGTFQKWEGDNGKTWASVDYCTAKNYKRKESEKGGALAKVFSPEGRSWGQAIVSFIKKMDEGGSSDGANRGTITEQDIKVGIGIMGSIAGLGSVYSLAIISNKPILLISSSLFTINNIDDAFTNADGESGFQQMVSSTQEKENIKNVKTAINIISVGSGYKSFVQSKDIYSGIGATISAISLSDSKLTETKNKNNTGENLRYPKSKPKFE